MGEPERDEIRIEPGKPFRGRLNGFPFRYDPAPDRADESCLVGLDRAVDLSLLPDERHLRLTPDALARALEASGREGPLRAAAQVRAWHDRPRAPRSRLARALRRPPRLPPSLAPLADEARSGETGAAFLARYAAPGRPVAPALARQILADPVPITDPDLLRALLALPLDWYPRDPTARADLACLVRGSAPLAAVLGSYDVLVPSRGRWTAFAALVARRLGLDPVTETGPWGTPGEADRHRLAKALRDACREIVDMLDAFADQVGQPVLARLGLGGEPGIGHPRGTAGLAAARVLAGDKGLLGLLDLSARWHAQIHKIDLALHPHGGSHGRWEAPFEPFRAEDGLLAVPLTEYGALLAEGASAPTGGLDHCVATYASACAGYRSTIVSIRRQTPGGAPRRLSTVELRPSGDGFAVAQHRGLRNGPPPPEATAVLDALTGGLAQGSVAVRPAYRNAVRLAGLARGPYGTRGYWRDPEALAAILAAWAPLLPAPLRGLDALATAFSGTARAIDAAWRGREGGYYAEARFGSLAQGHRPWQGPERAPVWPQRAATTLLAPVLLGGRLEGDLRRLAWRRGRPDLEPVLGRCAGIAVRLVALLLMAAFLAHGISHAFEILRDPGRGSVDGLFHLLLRVARDAGLGCLGLALAAHLILMTEPWLRKLRRTMANPSIRPDGAYLALGHPRSRSVADARRDGSRMVPQDR